jgi:alpha-glucosidase
MKHCLEHIDSYEANGSSIVFNAPNGSLRLDILGPDAVSFTYSFNVLEIDPVLLKATQSMLASSILKGAQYTLREEEGSYNIAIQGSSSRIVIRKTHAQISVLRNGVLVHGGSLGTSDTVIPSYQARIIENGTSLKGHFNFPLDEGDEFYGLGDKSGLPNRRGRKFSMFNRDSLAYDASNSDPLYKSMPFLIKTNPDKNICCALLFPQTLIDEIDLGRESPFYFAVKVDGGPFTYTLICRDALKDIMETYYDLTGHPELPPLFSFGFFGSSMNYVESDDAPQRILNYFDTIEKKDMACEGMYVSSGYLKADNGKRYTFLWNKRKFPDYGSYLRALSKRGYNLCMNIKPGILTSHPWYKDLEEKGYLIKAKDGKAYVEYFWGGDASFIDFNNPEAKAWWKKELKSQYLDHGCTGIWNDNNELELEDSELEAYKTKTLYPVLMAQASFEAFKEQNPDARPWIYSRSGYIGISRFARTWSGDNTSTFKALRYNQYMGIGMGLSGLPYFGHDIGGFAGQVPTEELLVRAAETAVFQCRFVIHSWREDDKPTEPWTYPGSEKTMKSLIGEHYHFLPYIYTQAYEASVHGTPIERSLHLEFPQDKAIPENEVNCLFGPSVLKINIVDPGLSTIKVHLPQGSDWVDPRTMTILEGGSTIDYDARITGKAHWLGKAGSVIPVSQKRALRAVDTIKAIDLIALPCSGPQVTASSFFWDDGATELSKGNFSLIEIINDSKSIRIKVKTLGCPSPQSLRLVLPGKEPIEISHAIKENADIAIPILN